MKRSSLHQIRASAGSGKTWTLTGNVLDLMEKNFSSANREGRGCATGNGACDWPEILAVTFTNRAAAEMKERVLTRLKDMALGVCTDAEGWPQDRAALAVERLLRDPALLNMRTIDSLLHLIVRLAALELGLPPDFETVFQQKAMLDPLLDDMAETAREDSTENDGLAHAYEEACGVALHRDNLRGFLGGDKVRDRIAELAVWLILHPQQELSTPEEISTRLDGLCAELRSAVARLAQGLEAEKLKVSAHLSKALAQCATVPDAGLPGNSVMLRKDSLDECLLKASKGRASDSVQDCYRRLVETVRIMDTEGAVLRSALRFMPFLGLARQVAARLPDFLSRAGVLPSDLLPHLAETVLETGISSAFCRLGSRLTHILVDEFQDTSLPQWRTLRLLAQEALARDGSLIMVGDVKQSIYGWRGGESGLFDIAPEDPKLRPLVQSPSHDTLSRNWRSRERVVSWNNAIFSRLGDPSTAESVLDLILDGPDKPTGEFCPEERDLRREAAIMLSQAFQDASQEVEKPGGLVRLVRLAHHSEEEDMARRVADTVRELAGRRPWGDICVLTRSNEQAREVASCLLTAGMPVVTQGSLSLSAQPVVAQMVALLAFLNCPDDDAAFWIVLTGMLPPLADFDVEPRARLREWAVERATRHSGGGLAATFRSDFPDVWQSVFAPLHDDAGLLTPYDTVREILEHWRVVERYPQSEGFVLRFLEVIHLAEQQGLSDLSAFLDWWDRNGDEEKAPLPENMDAVKVMTIHKAKGLEAEAVIVPWHHFPVRPGGELRQWEEGELSVIAPLSTAMGAAYRQAVMDNAREALHLLYVAWTRAKSELHCFLSPSNSSHMPAAVDLLVEPLREQVTRIDSLDAEEWLWGDIPEPSANMGVEVGTEPSTPETWLSDRIRPEMPSEEGGEAWRPMHWLPRLRIFRSPLPQKETDAGSMARRRGTLMHHCLEYLRISGDARLDAARAVSHGLDTFPLPLPDREELEQNLMPGLIWFAGLPQAAIWLENGDPEHSLLDDRGRLKRVDLLVEYGGEMVAVEYKTGTPGPLPHPEHTAQLGNYVELLRRATDKPCRGVLVYLDHQLLIPLGEPGLEPGDRP